MNYQRLKKILANIRQTPFHPQWFIYLHESRHYAKIGNDLKGIVLDIGCADRFMKRYLQPDTYYIGLDYYQTAVTWYKTHPHIFGDAQTLPFTDESVDTVLLLDVLEHLPRPEHCLQEIARVLKPGGQLVLQTPFVYPIHDAPLDFQRWTYYGLRQLIENNHFQVVSEQSQGKPLQTAALLNNIALVKTVINWTVQKNPLMIMAILTPIVILLTNLSYGCLSLLSPQDNMMPYRYCFILQKKA